MKQIYRTLSIFFLGILTACQAEDKDTSLLHHYLKDQFQTDIAEGEKNYILVAEQACHGCMDFVSGWIMNHPDDSSYIFILPEGFRKQLPSIPAHVLIDTTGTVSRLKFHRGNIGKVKTKNRKIIEYKAYDAQEMSSIFND